jgi:hypothetical protein
MSLICFCVCVRYGSGGSRRLSASDFAGLADSQQPSFVQVGAKVLVAMRVMSYCRNMLSMTLDFTIFVHFVLVQDVLWRQGLICYSVADDRARREASRLHQEAASLQETLSKLREDNLVREHLLAMNSLLERSIAQFNAMSDTIRRQVAEARQTEQLQEQKQQPQPQPQAVQAAALAAADSASPGAGVVARAGAQRKRKRSASAEPACKRRRLSPD